jgi:hypothetical protein
VEVLRCPAGRGYVSSGGTETYIRGDFLGPLAKIFDITNLPSF